MSPLARTTSVLLTMTTLTAIPACGRVGFDTDADAGTVCLTADLAQNEVCLDGHLYRLYPDALITWDESLAACEALEGHLVTITTAREQDALRPLFARTASDRSWIGGLPSSTSPSYEWLNGEPFSYENWETGEPDDGPDARLLAGLSGEWFDRPTDRLYPYVCEIE